MELATQREKDRVERERLLRLLGTAAPEKKRKPPRLDPVKSAAKMIEKNPALVARIKPDGEIEIAHGGASPSQDSKVEVELDATSDDDVWNAIASIRDGGHGKH